MDRPPVAIAVLGPTATGKSSLALALAERYGGEIINCDSTAVYRGFDIGTDKVPVAERRDVPHHLIDLDHKMEGDVLICGSDDAAKGIVAGLVTRIRDLRPIDVGDLRNARVFVEALLQTTLADRDAIKRLRDAMRKGAARAAR